MDFLAQPVTDTIRPFRDSELVVTRRWYRVPWGTPTLGFPSRFTSHRYMAYPWAATGAGEVFPAAVTFERRGTPDGLSFEHVCGTEEDFQLGAVFDPTVNVEYDSEWIPNCCGRAFDVCTFSLCAQAQVNDRPAAQQYTYPVPHQDAAPGTPYQLFQVALNQGNSDPAWPGILTAFFPSGLMGEAGWSRQYVADDSGAMQSVEETTRFAGDNALTQRQDASGYTFTVEQGAASGQLTLTVVDGVLTLGGVNFQIDPTILPPAPGGSTFDTPLPAGSTVGTATVLTATDNLLQAHAAGAGVVFPTAAFGTWEQFSVNNPTGQPSARIYAGAAGEVFLDPAGSGTVSYIDLPGGFVLVARQTEPGVWTVIDETSYGMPLPVPDYVTTTSANTFQAKQTIDVTTAATGAAQTPLAIEAISTGTPGFGFGVQQDFNAESSTHVMRTLGSLVCRWWSATDATRQAQLLLKVYDTAARNAIIVQTNGAAPMLGFFGVGAVARPTAGGSVAGFTNGSAASVTADATFTGGGAGGAYTIDDVVFALKSLGLLS